ncbi:signal peptidase I [Silvanigrella aquatica]|uniref:Signal peptidase I n=1 Tax=Silvanigrella aquatica TaxID=1915309 RepID=A0A1L4CYI0_9BACT|nr:signal peptidase I [Silvanigrella aquatica]APJ02985.1 signal peptidase I [Silvanigrella aquatica]
MKYLKEFKEILIVLILVVLFRSCILNWYYIPSGSMIPTLKIGDHVVVNKLSYGFMLPFMETQILSWNSPQRGDVVVFQGPSSEGAQVLIKRVIATSGDNVSFVNGVLKINGIEVQETVNKDRSLLQDTGNNDDISDFSLISESGFSKFSHYILRKKNGGITSTENRTWVVPEGKVFCMGDNRDNSYDGRFWGFTDEKSIYGRAFLISYSTGDKGMWPHLRNERWFMTLAN